MLNNIIPRPVLIEPASGTFTLTAASNIYIEPATPELTAIGQYLADKLNPATGYALKVLPATGTPTAGDIHLTVLESDLSLGEEHYDLTITPDLVKLVAYRRAGLFRGIQTIRQLLPPAIDSSSVQACPWQMAAGTIRDRPRFAWRGMMLDVARHFFSVADVKRMIDLIAYFKLNVFHVHLTDDQGWRIMIHSWPKLATHGGSTAVGGGLGGYYTQAAYADIVAYAQSRYITVVPEIDLPGHTHAALASYPELNSNGIAPALYTGTEVGFSSLCVDKDITDKFLDDVIKELAAITPGPYLHIGGDEALSTPPDNYQKFIEQVQSIVQKYGKQIVGWEEIAQSRLIPTSVAQHWKGDRAGEAIKQGAKVIISTASKAYLDMKYNASTRLGQAWAGYIDLPAAYDWDPATEVSGAADTDVLGIEAPLWTETLETARDLDYMIFPRLPGYAEIGWSTQASRNWDEYRVRLGTQGPRLTALGINFYRSPQIPWQ